MRERLVVVGVPGDRRTSALFAAIERAGEEGVCVPWLDVLSDPAVIRAHARAGDYLRVESPGADASVWHALSALGGDLQHRASGEWRPGRSWFRGLTRCLRALDAHVADLLSTHPSDTILAMTDKRVCHDRLVAASVPVPPTLPAVSDPDALREAMQRAGWSAVFVKPAWGSSGAGVMAYRFAQGRELLISTGSLQNGRLYNQKRLSRYDTRAPIDTLLARVLGDGALVQRWIPKSGHADGPLDIRVVVIDGHLAQRVGRIGRGPITNLHLDATRIAFDDVLDTFGASVRTRLREACLRAAGCFPGHRSVGVDVMIDPRGNPFVLECNAWGDYLPRLLIDGCDSYDVFVRGLFAPARAAETVA